MRRSRQARGYDRAWFKLRARHLHAFPLCRVCGAKGIAVDHIVRLRVAPHRRLDPTNLQTLCHHHHSLVTAAFDSERLRGACDESGSPLDPTHPWATSRAMQPALPTRLHDERTGGVLAKLKQDWVRRFASHQGVEPDGRRDTL